MTSFKRPMTRAVHLDFHTMPGIDDFNRDFDPAVFANTLYDAKVMFVNAFAKCNLGFAYYPTKIGVAYPGMKGDMFGSILRECHKRDIGVSAYLNVGLDHEQARRHRDWCVLNKDGQVVTGDRTGNFFRTMCYHTPGYRAYILGMIEEVLKNYDPDGLFLDCMGLFPCYGNECLESIAESGGDPLDDLQVRAHTQQVLMEFSKTVKRMLGTDKYLYLNGMPYDSVRDLDTHIEIECLPSAWSYDYFAAQAAYARNIQKTVLYMTGRFQTSWGDFGGFKGKASLENDIWDGLSQSLDISVGDHMHPAENLDPYVYETIGEIYADVKALEPWTAGSVYDAPVGVLTDSDGFLDSTAKGLARMLGELKIGFDIVNERMDFDRFDCLILPDRIRMTKRLQDKIKRHIANGKPLLASGTAGLHADESGFIDDAWPCEYAKKDPHSASYYRFEKDIQPDMQPFRWSMRSTGILLSPKKGSVIAARHVAPYFDRSYDGFHGYYYTPPKEDTPYAAAVIGGQVAHIGYRVFDAYYQAAQLSCKKLVQACLDRLIKNPRLKTQGFPSTARVTMARNDQKTLLHVKTGYPEPRGKMNIIEEHAVLPKGAKITVAGAYEKAYMAPDGKALAFEKGPDSVTVTLEQVEGYRLIVLE